MADEYFDEYDDEELGELRRRFVESVEPVGGDSSVWIEKAVLIVEGTDVASGNPAFSWMTWDRSDGEGIATWTVLGFLDYMTTKMRAMVPNAKDG